MTMKIEVTIPEDDIRAGVAADYLARAVAAIGYTRGVSLPMPKADEQNEVLADEGPNYAAMKALHDEAAEQEAPAAPDAIRFHGEPSEGRKRRTKEEITLDEEAADLLEDAGLTVAKFNEALKKAHGDWDAVMADLRAAAESKPAISTGEERVDPAQEDEPEQEEAEPLTHDDVRDALGDYAAKFGMPAAQKNGPKLMGADKISAIPDDQASLRKAVTAIRNAIAES
jgi:hypothetical protein